MAKAAGRKRRSNARRRGRCVARVGRVVLVLAVLAVAGAAVLWASIPDVGYLADENPDTTAFIELRERQAEEAGEPFELRWSWRRLPEISPYLQRAVVVSEDARFWDHDGVDWDAVENAAKENWEAKALVRGASTISQQVAKNLYLSPSRSPLRKLRELLITRRLEAELSKRRILAIYLNIAEWGPGVFGAEAAARHWFGRSADELTPSQAARLAVALPNPHTRSPASDAPHLVRRARRLVRAMHHSGLIDRATLERAHAELEQAP